MPASSPDFELLQAARQHQFLEVISRDEAMARFQGSLKLEPLGQERVPLEQAMNRVLAHEVIAPVDVPAFDRASVDGFAIQAADTFGITEEEPLVAGLNTEVLAPGIAPRETVHPGTATPIATGGMVPRGADAVVMIEHTELLETEAEHRLEIRRSAARRGECDIAGIHLMDPQTGEYNRPLLTPELDPIDGYRRMQGIVYRPGDGRFEGRSSTDALHTALTNHDCIMINRNAGSGTRILIDQLLSGNQPARLRRADQVS